MFTLVAPIRNWLVASVAAFAMLAGTAQAANFEFNYTDPAGQGIFDPVLGADRRAALEYAGAIWGSLIRSAYAGETIHVNAQFQAMPLTSTTLASASPDLFYGNFAANYPRVVIDDNHYPKALASHLHEADIEPGRNDITINFNSNVGTPGGALANFSFYYGTDALPPTANGQDFVSTAVHELGHGLGFFASFRSDGSYGVFGDGTYDPGDDVSGFKTIYDHFVWYVSQDGFFNGYLTNGDQSRIASALVSNRLSWSGNSGTAANGGTQPKLFAPNPFSAGSSISHVDQATLPNDLMTPSSNNGGYIPSAIDRGILTDMGWDISLAAATRTWTGQGADNVWATGNNWSSNSMPLGGDSVVFGASPQTDVAVHYGGAVLAREQTQVLASLTFAAGAPSHTLHYRNWTRTYFQGAGILTNSANPQTIILESSLEVSYEGKSAAEMTFVGSASAGGVAYQLHGGSTSIAGGPLPQVPLFFDRRPGASVTFNDNSSAGSGSFDIEGGSGDGGPNATITFRHNSLAGTAQFSVRAGHIGPSLPLGTSAGGIGGQINFYEQSTAAAAHIRNYGEDEYPGLGGGLTQFFNQSSAGAPKLKTSRQRTPVGWADRPGFSIAPPPAWRRSRTTVDPASTREAKQNFSTIAPRIPPSSPMRAPM